LRCVDRMLAFTAAHPERLAQAQHGFVRNLGSA
jgi:quinolinate synthase